MPIIDGTAYVFQPALPMRGVTPSRMSAAI